MLDGVTYAVPGFQGDRCQESELLDRLTRVRHPAPDRDTAFGGSAQVPQRRAHDCRQGDVNGHASNRNAEERSRADGPAGKSRTRHELFAM